MSFKLSHYFLIFLLFYVNIGLSQNTFIPDDNFEQFLIEVGFDTPPLDNFVPTANIVNVTSLTMSNRNIRDLTGIEDFEGLTQLFVQDNLLIDIDISNNKNLQIFWCFNNTIPNIDVSQNQELLSLRCEGNNLSNLDISNNSKLSVLTCENNQITNLDTSKNINLDILICSNNRLNSLELSKNTALVNFVCEENFITNLNLENNPKLSILNCSNNLITILDLSLNSELVNLKCNNNQLCLLNIKNNNNIDFLSVDFNENPDLNCVIVDNLNGNRMNWFPTAFTNYVESIDDCNSGIDVDMLNDVIATSYTLPVLTQGDYFTQLDGNGIMLNAGDILTSSQTIYIYDTASCFSTQSSFNFIVSDQPYFIPKYFTPNNDGINDVWNVTDPNNQINNISIYNRFGKLIKHLPRNSQGWDGTFNGRYLPTNSYWYEIVLDNQEILRGYFALKR